MKLNAIKDMLQLRALTPGSDLEGEVSGAYVSDLLSDVIANSREGELWITLQIHQNTIAVAKLKDLAGIIIINNRKPEPKTLTKAEKENVPIFQTAKPAFVIAGRLYRILKPKE